VSFALNSYLQRTGIIVTAFIWCLLLPNGVAAAQSAPVGISISPVRTELDVKPGSSYSNTLQVTNPTLSPVTVSLGAEGFKTIDPQYDYAFGPSSSVAHWISFSTSVVTLKSKSTRAIQYTVAAPLGAEPHGEYVSLFATVTSNLPDSSVRASERVASLLYITIDGNVTRLGDVLSAENPWLVTTSGAWSISIHNKGTDHFRSIYSISTETLFGVHIASDITSDVLILPDTIRDINGPMPLPEFPGVYKIVYSVGLGDAPAAHLTRYFLYLPLIPSFTLLALIFIGLGFLPKYRRHSVNKDKGTV